jgi:cell division septum initiation protein DivIVA
MSLKSSLATAKSLSDLFGAIVDAEKVITEAVRLEAAMASNRHALAALAAEVNAAADDKDRAKAEADLIRSDAKTVKEVAQAGANALVADAKAEAATIITRAKEDAEAILEAARGKVAEHEANVKTLEDAVAKLTADAEAAESRLAKAKESIAKLLG